MPNIWQCSVFLKVHGSRTFSEASSRNYSSFCLTFRQIVEVTEYFYQELSYAELVSALGGTLGFWMGLGVMQIIEYGFKFPLPTSFALPAFKQMKDFLMNCDKIICHDRVDYKTMVSWFIRNNFEDIFQSKIQLDSQDFYKHVMEQHGSRQCGMKAIVETLANDKVKKFYEKNKHSALGDAETLCRLSNSKAMHDRFRSWVICFNSLIGPAKERIVQKRSQSVQRHYYPG